MTMILKFAFATLIASAALFATGGAAATRQLAHSEARSLIGGAVSLSLSPPEEDEGGDADESDWWAICVADAGCTRSAEKNNGLGCPSSFTEWGGVGTMCPTKTCVISCAKPLAAEICEDDAFWDCYYDSSLNSPGICGAGATGKCSYSPSYWDGWNWTTCTILGPGCVPDGGTVNCGIAHSCYSID